VKCAWPFSYCSKIIPRHDVPPGFNADSAFIDDRPGEILRYLAATTTALGFTGTTGPR
jgi:hypothetical protein